MNGTMTRDMTATTTATTIGRGRLYEGADWDFGTIQRIHDACEDGTNVR